MNKETFDFIIANAEADVQNLALKGSKNEKIDLPFSLQQIEGKQKIKHKVPTFYNHPHILYPKQLSVEQSSSESTACYKQSLCKGDSMADITGGFGIDFYFISKNFNKRVYVEQNADLCKIVENNMSVLSHENYNIFNVDAIQYLENSEIVDWLYIDPARRDHAGRKTVSISDCNPNVLEIMPLIRKKARRIMLKLSPMLDIYQALSVLPNCMALHVVAYENECKEILFLLDSENEYDKYCIEITCVNILKNAPIDKFVFSLSYENSCSSSFSKPIQHFIYEPNVAIMKAGAFKSIAQEFDLNKIAVNTHLYHSELYIPNFPGRIFATEQTYSSSKKDIKSLKTNIKNANIIVRNFVLSVDELKKKLEIHDGGDDYLLAFRNVDAVNLIVHCKRLK